MEEHLKEKGVSKNTKDPESSNSESIQFEEGDGTKVLEQSENKERTPEKLEEGMKENVFTSILDHESSNKIPVKLKEAEQDISKQRDCCESSSRAMIEKLDEFVKTLRNEMYELKKEIFKELKEMKQQAGKKKKSAEENKMKRKNWQRMKSALNRYDVSMDDIQAFQRFRFYCVAGYLPWPFPIEEIEEQGLLCGH